MFQCAHVYRAILVIHWFIVLAVNVKVIPNAQTVVPVLIMHALIHALVNAVRMQFVKLNDILPCASAQEAMMVMLHHHAFDNHAHTIHFRDTIRKSEQQQQHNQNDLPIYEHTHKHKHKNTPNETYTLINDLKTKINKAKRKRTKIYMSLYVFKAVQITNTKENWDE